jgi:hypothetical protein
MFNLVDIFQLVVNRFNDISFSQDNLVVNEHEGIPHILFQFGNQLDIIYKKHIEQFFGDIILCRRKLERIIMVVISLLDIE